MAKRLQLKLATTFLLSTAVLAVIVLIEGGIIIKDSMIASSQSTELAENRIPLLDKAHRLKLTVVQVQQWLTDISATRGRDGLNDGFDEAESNAKQFKALIDEIAALDTANAEHYQAMLPVFDAYYEVGKKMAQSYIDEGPAGGNKVMAQFDEVAASMAFEVDGFLEHIDKETKQALNNQQVLAASTVKLVAAGSLVILIGIGLIYLVISRTLAFCPGLWLNCSEWLMET